MSKDDPIVYVLDDDYRVRESLTSVLSSVGLRSEVFAFRGGVSEIQKSQTPLHVWYWIWSCRHEWSGPLSRDTEMCHPSLPAMNPAAIEFLLKPFDDQELLRSIDAAIAQDREARLKRVEMAELRRRYALLTPREREVLPFVVAGLLNKQTAAELGISEITIQVHRGQIMRKMVASSLADLVKMAGKLGIS